MKADMKCYLKYNNGENPCLLLVVFVILTPKLNLVTSYGLQVTSGYAVTRHQHPQRGTCSS